jgi:hypothetical protein
MPQGGGEHDFWPLGVEIVPGSKTPYLIDRNLLIDFHKVLYRTLVHRGIYAVSLGFGCGGDGLGTAEVV